MLSGVVACCVLCFCVYVRVVLFLNRYSGTFSELGITIGGGITACERWLAKDGANGMAIPIMVASSAGRESIDSDDEVGDHENDGDEVGAAALHAGDEDAAGGDSQELSRARIAWGSFFREKKKDKWADMTKCPTWSSTRQWHLTFWSG